MPKGIPNQKYTGEFKQHVVETMQFGIGNHSRVSHWERTYLEEGPEGLYIERRGRGSKGRPASLPKQTEEDLIAEVQRLRA